MLSFASVCSGIEAASVAFEPLGWRCLWLAEIDKAASGVLAHRYPGVPNLGDLTTLPARMRAGEMEPPDVLIGGTPCQAFSIAGLRGGMDDHRGALTMAFVDLAEAIDERRLALGLPPCTIVWENVPGVLNHKDNPFGCFLGGLAGEDLPLEPAGKRWTNAGLVSGPERAIGWRTLDAQYFGLAQRRRRVFVVASARQGFDPAAILFEREGVRRDIAPRREAGQGLTHPVATCLTSSGRGVERTGDARGQDPVVAVESPAGLAYGGGNCAGPIAAAAAALNANERFDFDSETFVVEPTIYSIMPIVTVALRGREGGATAELGGEVATALRASTGGGDKPHILTPMAVRRLMPVECERLQGFPDGWTAHGAKPQADGPRYKQLGNSMAVPVIRWLGRRIETEEMING